MKFILFLLPFMVFCACKSNEKTASFVVNEKQLIIYNADSTLLLVKEPNEVSPQNPIPMVRFYVIDLILGDTLYRDLENNSSVDWFDNYHLKITRVPGTITTTPQPEDNMYILNPKQGKIYNMQDHPGDSHQQKQ